MRTESETKTLPVATYIASNVPTLLKTSLYMYVEREIGNVATVELD